MSKLETAICKCGLQWKYDWETEKLWHGQGTAWQLAKHIEIKMDVGNGNIMHATVYVCDCGELNAVMGECACGGIIHSTFGNINWDLDGNSM